MMVQPSYPAWGIFFGANEFVPFPQVSVVIWVQHVRLLCWPLGGGGAILMGGGAAAALVGEESRGG